MQRAVQLPAVSAAATPTASATIASASAAASAPLHFWTRFVDVQRASAQLRSVQSGNRLLAIFAAGHLHESEPAGTASITIGHDTHALHLSVHLEHLPQ